MCGIAGCVGWGLPPEPRRAVLRAMCSAIEHRGPDDEGIWADERAGLGMRRLSIIDVAGGQQPIENEDGSMRVVFNGEIYNHRELRTRLERSGHRFSTQSDTEVLVHLYEEHGDDLVGHLHGMFAFAIWDEHRQRLFCARDRLGIKPLSYWTTSEGLVFASELRSLLAFDGFPARVSRAAVGQYLAFGYVPDPLTIFEDVRKVPPGHRLSWSEGEGVRVGSYWDVTSFEERPWDEEEARRRLTHLLDESVSCRLESEVPLGAFLSGGVDSSAVVSTMARHMDRPVKTFAIGFAEGAYNEAGDARRVATALQTDHTELVMTPDVDGLVDDLVAAYDEPFSDSSAIPTYLVSRLARDHVKVVLSGDGGDELFGGYERYAKLLRRSEFPTAVRSVARRLVARIPHGMFGRNFLLDSLRSRRGQYANQVAAPLTDLEGGVAQEDMAAAFGELEWALTDRFDAVADRDFASQMMMVDILTYLPGDILTKVDRASMAVSLEARVPLLDHRLVEFAVSLPESLKFVGGRGKQIFRDVVGPLVPAETLAKPKQGFAVPLAEWFRGPLAHRLEAVLAPDNRGFEYLKPEAVQRIVREHSSGRRDHSQVLWRLLVLSLWLARLSDGSLAKPTPRDLVAAGAR